MYNVVVDAAKCEGCEECVTNCPQGVFQMADGKSITDPAAECVFCETCTSVCPSAAITISEM